MQQPTTALFQQEEQRATPESSLGLLYGTIPWMDAELLAGKTAPISVVQRALDGGERLGPDTCGWHYVDELRLDDDPRLALFWDKIGLGHNGQRLAGGGHTVLFVGGNRRQILAFEWQDFVKEQKKLFAERGSDDELRVDALTQIGGKRVQVQLRIVDGSLYGRVWWGGRNSSGELLAHIDREPNEGIVGLPIVTVAEVRNARVVVDQPKGTVRFILKDRAIVCDGQSFHFEQRR